MAFPDSLILEDDPARALCDARLVVIAVPSERFRDNIRQVAESVPADAVMLSVTKGLELPAGLRMSQVLAEELPNHPPERFAVLSRSQPGR